MRNLGSETYMAWWEQRVVWTEEWAQKCELSAKGSGEVLEVVQVEGMRSALYLEN